jgi:hypothetical protein
LAGKFLDMVKLGQRLAAPDLPKIASRNAKNPAPPNR